MHVNPTREQIKVFATDGPAAAPVFMLNLLRFKDVADGPHDGTGISGAEAYARYAQETGAHLARVGGEVIWAGACDTSLIGPAEGEWDIAAVVRYPSRAAFLEMVGDPDYQEAAQHRTAAIADSRLIPCAEARLGT